MYKLHVHKVNWHEFGMHFGHLVHDPRFWAAVAIIALLGLMILMAMLSKPAGNINARPVMPTYPYGIPY